MKWYFVRMPEAPGDEMFGPYTLSSAKDFARIGSKFGGPRLVLDEASKIIRLYEKGYRRFPRGHEEIKQAGLTTAETPRVANPYAPGSVKAEWRE